MATIRCVSEIHALSKDSKIRFDSYYSVGYVFFNNTSRIFNKISITVSLYGQYFDLKFSQNIYSVFNKFRNIKMQNAVMLKRFQPKAVPAKIVISYYKNTMFEIDSPASATPIIWIAMCFYISVQQNSRCKQCMFKNEPLKVIKQLLCLKYPVSVLFCYSCRKSAIRIKM